MEFVLKSANVVSQKEDFMMHRYTKWFRTVLFALFTVHLLFPTNSSAYLDPGTGSFIIQSLIAFVIGGLFTLKIFFKNIKAFFYKHFTKREKDEHLQ